MLLMCDRSIYHVVFVLNPRLLDWSICLFFACVLFSADVVLWDIVRCPSQRTPRATYPTAVEDDSSKETDRIPTPKVIIDQDSNPDATIVEVAFGDRLGALLDTVFDPVPWIVPHIL
ncbi:ACT domain-containing protein DS12, chloroplastic-like [Zingiber officinale]|uniref:ACT domain-containing protein DS12, chloroplastic-like n=1 Tax=Zingiber officinale TaxID=94328 RepID=UPI001C4D7F1C|nr:ACT domain-containing protein DS12, chloroplastic-like [Zingiber officinale]